MMDFDGRKGMLSQNPTVVWAIAVSPQDRWSDRIKSLRKNQTYPTPVTTMSRDRILPTSFEIECDLEPIEQNFIERSVILRFFLSERKMMMHLIETQPKLMLTKKLVTDVSSIV
jgi:hypothetical protein